jgi:hypothetical protein
LIRAAGPGLKPFNVASTLGDPVLEIWRSQETRTNQDNWVPALSAVFAQVGAFQWSAGGRDAALELTLPAGSYTTLARGRYETADIGLVEIYDAD